MYCCIKVLVNHYKIVSQVLYSMSACNSIEISAGKIVKHLFGGNSLGVKMYERV